MTEAIGFLHFMWGTWAPTWTPQLPAFHILLTFSSTSAGTWGAKQKRGLLLLARLLSFCLTPLCVHVYIYIYLLLKIPLELQHLLYLTVQFSCTSIKTSLQMDRRHEEGNEGKVTSLWKIKGKLQEEGTVSAAVWMTREHLGNWLQGRTWSSKMDSSFKAKGPFTLAQGKPTESSINQ